MKRFIFAVCVVTFFVASHLRAQDEDPAKDKGLSNEYFAKQGELMECEPPKFFLVEDVDLEAGTIVGMSSVKNKTSILAFHMRFKLDEVKLTNARRAAIDKAAIKKLKGQMVVMTEGKKPLGAAYLGLFREDTVVMSILPPPAPKKK